MWAGDVAPLLFSRRAQKFANGGRSVDDRVGETVRFFSCRIGLSWPNRSDLLLVLRLSTTHLITCASNLTYVLVIWSFLYVNVMCWMHDTKDTVQVPFLGLWSTDDHRNGSSLTMVFFVLELSFSWLYMALLVSISSFEKLACEQIIIRVQEDTCFFPSELAQKLQKEVTCFPLSH